MLRQIGPQVGCSHELAGRPPMGQGRQESF
jgi:hypothetical protein